MTDTTTSPPAIPSNDDRIFPYFDGRGHVYADPSQTLRVLIRLLGGAPNAVRAESRSDQPLVAEQAIAKLVAASREAFDLAAFDRVTGQGVLDDDAMTVLDDFLRWLEQKKTTGGRRRTFAPLSAPPPSSVPGLSPPKPASVSGSTSNDCGCGK